MDVLSDVLSLLKPRIHGAGGFDMGGEWSIAFSQHQGIKCYAIVSGQCWLSVDSVPESLFLQAGDCFFLPQGRPFRLASDLNLTPVVYVDCTHTGSITTSNGGGDCFIVGGHYALDGVQADVLLNALSPVVHIRDESDKATLRWSIDRMRQELSDPRPGTLLITQHLAHMMLVQALRLHVAEGLKGGVGWLFALEDKQVGAAIHAMHGDPAHRWTLQELARYAAMSRSAFVMKFRVKVGMTPMTYLTRWRMLLASDKLINSADSISVISLSLGYESEAAFSTAFKRVMGTSPRRYSRTGVLSASWQGNDKLIPSTHLELL